MGDWQMKRVRRDGSDVTDTPLDFDKDVNGLEIEVTPLLNRLEAFRLLNHSSG